MAKFDISIIVISFNTKQITKKCLDSIVDSLKDSPINYEIVVVDNNSKDGSVKLLRDYQKKLGDKFSLILNKENAGFGKANNQAVKVSRANYILFLNSDAFAFDNSIPKLYDFYRKNGDKIHFLGGKLFNPDMTVQPSAAPFFTLPIVFLVMFTRSDYWRLTRYSPDKFKRVDWVSGACILTEKEIFEKVGGFDEGVFMYMEEVDLLYRGRKMGYSTYFYPDAKFVHIGFASSGKSKSYPVTQVFRGLLYFYKKHRTPLSLSVLKIMLKLKAGILIFLGRLLRSRYLTQTYEKAYQLTKMG